MGAVDVCLGEVELAAIPQILGQPAQQPLECAVTSPALESAMTRRRRRVASRKIGPRRAGAQHPENGIQYVSRITPRPTAFGARPRSLRTREEPANSLPLLVSDIHPHGRSQTRSAVDPRGLRVMRCALVETAKVESGPETPPNG